jgi:hypothetical protein
MFEHGQREELDKDLRQALHHLGEVGLETLAVRRLLLATLKTIRSGSEWCPEKRKAIVNTIAKAKNEIGDVITRAQSSFKGYPTVEQLARVEAELKDVSEL